MALQVSEHCRHDRLIGCGFRAHVVVHAQCPGNRGEVLVQKLGDLLRALPGADRARPRVCVPHGFHRAVQDAGPCRRRAHGAPPRVLWGRLGRTAIVSGIGRSRKACSSSRLYPASSTMTASIPRSSGCGCSGGSARRQAAAARRPAFPARAPAAAGSDARARCAELRALPTAHGTAGRRRGTLPPRPRRAARKSRRSGCGEEGVNGCGSGNGRGARPTPKRQV